MCMIFSVLLMIQFNFIRLMFVCLMAMSSSVQASDLTKEKRWADQVVEAILDGDEDILLKTVAGWLNKIVR